MDIDSFFDLNGGLLIEKKFVRLAIKSILDECLNQLLIMRHLNVRNADIFDPFVVQYKTIEDRFTGTENHGETRIPTLGTNQDKISHDINIFINIIKETSLEIDNYGTYKVLKESIRNIKCMDRDEKHIFQSKEENEKLIKLLTSKCEDERITNLKTIQNTNEKIHKVRFEVEDAIVYGKTQTDFFKKFESSRRDQNNIVCQTQEKASSDVIREIERKIELENKCHKLFLDYIDEDQLDLLELINYWVETYDSEIESRENALLKLKGKLEYTQDTLEKHINKYNKRQSEIDKWIAYKDMKQKKEDQVKNEIRAVMKIQSWWRGTMCRKSIPPGHMIIVAVAKGKKGKK